MSDLISRQAAIDAIFSEPLYETGLKKRDAEEVVPAIFEKIKTLPSVQPAPCEFCKHNNIADDKACLMCSAERRTDVKADKGASC